MCEVTAIVEPRARRMRSGCETSRRTIEDTPMVDPNRLNRRLLLSTLALPFVAVTAAAELGSRDRGKATKAVESLYAGGESSIEELMSFRGNRAGFLGYGLGRPESSCNLRAVASPESIRDGRAVTVEVAALYLICAIYEEDLSFAHCPFLCDESLPKEKKRHKNLPKLIKRAWRSVDQWYSEYRALGIGELRLREDRPLKRGNLTFWGGL